jgi:exopolyphosphatase/guanosine-5'-triphosphate,3'-diphosphate pyrophosphatase
MDVLPLMLAVVDLGTNTFNLAVGEVLHGRLFLHHTAMRVVLLKKEGLPNGDIAEAAWQRASLAVKELMEEARAAGATRVQAVGTSALRNAAQASLWMAEMQNMFGLRVQLVSGAEEARLIWQGVAAAGALAEDALLVDIGGGSVEWVHGNQQQIHWLQSIEMGMARVQQAVPWSDPIVPKEIAAVRAWLKERLAPVMQYAQSQKISRLVGAAGAFDTLYSLHSGELSPATLAFVPREEVLGLTHRLLALSRAERTALPAMPPLRVDMQLYALLLMEQLLLALPQVPGITTTSWSLREGVLASEL